MFVQLEAEVLRFGVGSLLELRDEVVAIAFRACSYSQAPRSNQAE